MTYIYQALRDGPIGLWSFDSLPLIDSSGYGNDASYVGTPTTTRPIVADGVASQVITSDDTVNYPVSSVMIEGRETRAFSLEAWIKPQSGTAAIMARDNSGLFLDGLKLVFSMEFDDLVSAEYRNLVAGEIYHVVGVYDGQSIGLYLNGEMVSSAEVSEGGIVDSTADLKTTMSSTMVMDSPAVYGYALESSAIKRHYNQGVSYPEIVNLSVNNGGKSYVFSDQSTSIYQTLSFGESDDWASGLFEDGVAQVDDKIVNIFNEEDVEWSGGMWTYQYSIDSDTGEDIELNGSRITWDSPDSITVETSTDGISWTPVSNGSQIVGTQDLSTGYAISIRITIPTTTIAQAVVNNLKVVFYKDKTIKGSDESLPAVFVDPLTITVSDDTYNPASFNDNDGVLLPADNGFSITEDTEFGGYFAVEMTVKFSSSTINKTVMLVDGSGSDPTITSNGSGQWVFSNLTALYINGVAVTSPVTLPAGLWYHVLAVFPETMGDVYIGNNVAGTSGYPMRVGFLALYSDTISATMAEAIYDEWVGVPAVQIDDDSTSTIEEHTFSETSSPFRAYTFDWSITGAG